MARIVFFTHAKPEQIERVEFYRQDVDALRALGHEVVICTRFTQVPRRFDAMFVWWWTHALAPVLLCRARRKPCIVTGTFNFRFPPGFEGTDFLHRPAWQRLLVGAAARGAHLNLFVSQLEYEACAKHFGLTTARYYPHCVDQDYLQGPLPQRRTALFSLSWSGRKNLIRKGVPEILEAVRLLKDRGQKVQVALAGMEGDGAGWLRERIAALGIGDEVKHLGQLTREEKIRLLREHEIYVQPSHFEGFGVAILEAMGCGACVIVCDVGAVREVVGDCGIYTTRGSAQDLAANIGRVLQDEPLRRRMQETAAARARELFTFERKLERLAGYLREVGIAS